MHIPSKKLCDICEQEILEGAVYARLDMPIPPSLRSEIAKMVKENRQPTPEMVFGPMVMVAMPEQVPDTWELAMHPDCAHGLLPSDVREKIKTQIFELIRRRLAAKQRAEQSAAELEA